ncbi:ABC transporter ATP-binding protein [Novibacillus thermophilus]|uniref:Bacitracin ABC transporter ATP-binding protein n=1 Tax=Novibacillus thermophilus TaxID=1471761 RepID=A0A1U9K4A3_9BACL|nr:ABC transporter ATP-binding protein [Novibacillus thermophilus]AQS54858.1 bacitracin ABC transporter ATP-binding protein [Novibacillus thermophilus]
MSEMVIETNALTRRYGKRTAVDRVDLCVPRGEIYGFLGPNGAGKTTTIRMLLGLIRPTAGTVRLFGENFHRHRMSVLRRVGSLVESPSYYGHLTGAENLEVVRRLLGAPKKRIAEALEIVRLTEAADRPVKGYSLGMKQRLGIAIALLGHPELLILDEPTNGLDPAGIQEMRRLIKDMPRKYGMTVLVSSHLLSEIDQISTQVGIIHEGRLIFQDRIEALRQKSGPRTAIGVDRMREASAVLEGSGWRPHIEDGLLWLDETEPEQVSRVNALLVKNGFSVYRLEEVKPSLEEVFLELTGKGNSL